MADNSTLAEMAQYFADEYSSSLIENYFILSSTVFMLHDYLLTFPAEVRYIWRGRLNITKALFILNRYIGLIYMCTLTLISITKPASNEVTGVLVILAISSIFTLRTSAVYGRSWIVFFLLAIPGLVNAASLIWTTVIQTASALPRQLQMVAPFACTVTESSSVNARCLADTFYRQFVELAAFFDGDIGFLVSAIAQAVFDVLVVIMTIYRTARLAAQCKKVNSRALSYILLRDGILYYTAVFVPTLLLIVLDLIANNNGSQNLTNVTGDLTALSFSLQVVAANRLVLDLSYAADATEDTDFFTHTGLEPPEFVVSSVIGNIGGPIRTNSDTIYDDDSFLREDEVTSFLMDNMRASTV